MFLSAIFVNTDKHKAAIDACHRKFQQESYQYGLYRIESRYKYRKEGCLQEAKNKRTHAENLYLIHPRENAEDTAWDMVRDAWEAVDLKEETLALLKHGREKRGALKNMQRPHLISNAHMEMDDILWCLYDPAYFRNAIVRCEEELAPLRERAEKLQVEADQWLKETMAALLEKNQPLYEQEIQKIDLWEQERLVKIEEDYQKELAEASEMIRTLPDIKKSELDAIEADYQRQKNMLRYDPQAVQILIELLKEHFRKAYTPLKGKKVFCDLQEFDLNHSGLDADGRSEDGGYIRSGIAWKIPDDAKYVRFFIYWNDPQPVIIDLHAGGITEEKEKFHVGWNTYFHGPGVLHSGDVLHSDAAQYIDIDMSAPLEEVYTNIHLWHGKPGFRYVETCYVGMMAVDKIGQEVKLYSPKNCFFTHELNQKCRNLFYGYVDVQNRYIRFVGKPNQNEDEWAGKPQVDDSFSLQDYLNCVLEGQNVELVETAEEADVVLTMGKSLLDNGISLVDNNFFLEC